MSSTLIRKKITYIISHVNYSNGFDWTSLFLNQEKFELSFIFIDISYPEMFQLFQERGHKVFFIPYSSKIDIPRVLLRLALAIRKIQPEIIHTQLFWASFFGLPVAKIMGIRNRIMTRHHSSYHIQNYPKMVKLDNFNNKMATKIVAISNTVKDILINIEKVPNEKVILINHGFDFNEMQPRSVMIMDDFKRKYKITNHYPVIGAISRFIEWKGIQFVIPAFKKLLAFYPNAKLVLANAKGNYSKELNSMLDTLPAESFIRIDFEKDVYSLFYLFDVFVHVPIDKDWEAFGQTYVEALACKIPSVFTLSGIAKEFITDEKNALVVPFCDQHAIFEAIVKILNEPKLRKQLQENGFQDVSKKFGIKTMIDNLEALYD